MSHEALSGEQFADHVSAYTSEYKPGHFYLRNLAVAPEHRGKGIGTQFMHSLLAAHDQAGTSVTLHCREDLVPWYSKMGFEPEEDDMFGTRMTRKPR